MTRSARCSCALETRTAKRASDGGTMRSCSSVLAALELLIGLPDQPVSAVQGLGQFDGHVRLQYVLGHRICLIHGSCGLRARRVPELNGIVLVGIGQTRLSDRCSHALLGPVSARWTGDVVRRQILASPTSVRP